MSDAKRAEKRDTDKPRRLYVEASICAVCFGRDGMVRPAEHCHELGFGRTRVKMVRCAYGWLAVCAADHRWIHEETKDPPTLEQLVAWKVEADVFCFNEILRGDGKITVDYFEVARLLRSA